MSNKQIVSTVFDDGDGVLVDLDSKRYYHLNETAMLVWSGLEQGQTINQIADQFTSTYDVTPTHAVTSVEKILQKFHSLELTDQPGS